MIQLSSAGKRFGPKLLFENLDWLITSHDRVGLVGANGTGKSRIPCQEIMVPIPRVAFAHLTAYGITVHTGIVMG